MPGGQGATIEIVLNGEGHRLPAGATVLDLLAGLGRDPRAVAVERNGDLLPRGEYAATPLAAGDRLEVVHFVQGGAEDEEGRGDLQRRTKLSASRLLK